MSKYNTQAQMAEESKRDYDYAATMLMRLFLPTPPYLIVPPHTKYENTILSFFFHPLEFEIISLWII